MAYTSQNVPLLGSEEFDRMNVQSKPTGELQEFPTSLDYKAQTAGQVAAPTVTPTVNFQDIGTPATQQIDTQPVQQFKDTFGSSQDILDTLAGAEFLDTKSGKEADAISDRIAELSSASIESETAELQEKAGIPDLETQLTDILSEAKTIKASLTKGLVKEEGRVVPMGVITGRQAQLRRQAAAELEGLSAIASTLQGKISDANNRIDRALDRKYGVIKAEIDAQQQLLSRIETREAAEQSAKLTALQTRIETQIQREQEAMASITTAMGNGLSSSVGADLMSKLARGEIESAEVFATTGGYLVDPLDRAIKSAQLRKLNLDIAEYNSTEDVESGEFGATVNDAAGLVGAERGKIIRKNMTEALKDGDYSRAFNQAANAVEESLTGENATKFGAQRNDYIALAGLRDAINTYAAGGGDLNLLTGTAEEISNKLLGVTGDPELTALATQLNREFQAYRTAATGAAFSPEESRDYAKVNPRTNATLELNNAIIDGAMNQIENRIKSTVSTRVSGADKLWDIVSGQTTNEYLNDVDLILSDSASPLDQYIQELDFSVTTPQ